jgi:hypothetical protein
MTIYFFLDPANIKVVAAFTNESEAAQYAHEVGDVHNSRVYEKTDKWDGRLLMVGRKIELDKYTGETEWLIDG